MKSKALKIVLIIVAVIIVIALLWYFLKGSSGTWTVYPNTDIYGSDIKSMPSGTLDQDKATAVSLGAKAFVTVAENNTTYYKSAASPTATASGGTKTLYVLN